MPFACELYPSSAVFRVVFISKTELNLFYSLSSFPLTHKQQEMHGHIFCTVATDALVLKHQAISISNTN